VLVQYVTPIVGGAVAGLLLAVGGSQAMRGELYGLAPLDPVSYATGIAGLGAAAIVAMLLPAWRALRINPASALRWE